MAECVVIIGAGGSGRGFIARLLQDEDVKLCFVDRDRELVEALNKKGEYKIQVGSGTSKIVISNYEAFVPDEEKAVVRAAQADWIFTAVGEENLKDLVSFLERVAEKRGRPVRIVACENGVAPKLAFRKALKGSKAQNSIITQGVIFCTSIPERKGSLDIISEDYPELPYDIDEELFRLPFAHFPATPHLDRLLQRKIYTYNCLSACISYLGAYLKYDIYSDAANDALIRQYCGLLLSGLNRTLCRSMNVAPKEQFEFSRRALKKFSNPNISDTIQKNARSVVRKLSPTERIMGPMKLMEQYGEDTFVLRLVAAAALLYLERNEDLRYQNKEYSDVLRLFRELNPQIGEKETRSICEILNELREGKSLKKMTNERRAGNENMGKSRSDFKKC